MREARRIIAAPTATAADYDAALDGHRLETGDGVLRPVQRQALGAFRLFGGVAMQAGCGDGKTLVGALAPVVMGSVRPLILVPGKLRSEFWRQCEIYRRLGFAVPDNLEVRSHDEISRRPTWLDEYAPDLIWIDEAHAYRRPEAARTRRLLRYLDANPTQPNGGRIAFGVASGTLASSSVLDFAHLLTHALGDRCPVPRRTGQAVSGELGRWSRVLDVDGRPALLDWQRFGPLIWSTTPEAAPAYYSGNTQQKRHAARRAYAKRRETTAGLVCSASESVAASLVIYVSEQPAPPPEVAAALDAIKRGERPDGEVLVSDADRWRAAQHASIGCVYRWAWERTPLGRPDLDWLSARRIWARKIRSELEHRAGPNYDSPGQIAAAVEADLVDRHNGRAFRLRHLHDAYTRWFAVRDRYRAADLLDHVWISRWYVDHVADQARADGRPVVIWYESDAMAEALADRGIPVFGAGDEAPDTAITCALSRRRFGTGANLQDRWSVAHFAEFPPSAEAAEQTLARLHRPGQSAPVVEARIYCHTAPFRRNLDRARDKARFLDEVQGRQRLSVVPIVPMTT